MTDLFEYAKQRRDLGMAMAADAQDRDDPAWSATAFLLIESLARSRPEIHVDDVRTKISPPAHPNCWGAVWMKAKKCGLIENSGRVKPSTDPKKHAHQYPIYRSLVYRRGA